MSKLVELCEKVLKMRNDTLVGDADDFHKLARCAKLMHEALSGCCEDYYDMPEGIREKYAGKATSNICRIALNDVEALLGDE